MYQVPRGMNDILPAEIGSWQQLERLLRDFSYLYNVEEIRTPVLEHTGVFKRENDSSDMVNKEMYTFQLPGSSDSLTIRPEGTAGVVRSFVENKLYASPDLPVKLFYIGSMARHERPQKGRQRIFHQYGVEFLGTKSPFSDAEAIVMAYSILKALGLNDLRVELNTLGSDADRARYREALREYFAPHVDELCADCKRRYEQNPLRILDCKIDGEKEIVKNAPLMKDYLSEESKAYFQTVLDLLEALDIPYTIQDNLVRGLDYYTDTVFEIVSENKEMGAQSTILAGGRYDHLIPYFGGPEGMSGIGWAVGLERLLIALQAEGLSLAEEPEMDAYVMVLDEEARPYAFQLLCTLRANGFRADMDQQGKGFKGQFKAATRAGAKTALLIGTTELENGTATIKDLLKKEQQTVPYDEMCQTIDDMIHGEDEHDHAACDCGDPNCKGDHHHHE